MHIAIAGNIGSGKTTLTKMLAAHYGWIPKFESVDFNPYLSDFYEDMERWSFNLQIYFLNKRFKDVVDISKTDDVIIQDRTIYEDSVFAAMLAESGLMDPRDYKTYVQLFRYMSNFMCKPNVIVYLDVKPERSLERIKMRSRGCEAGVSLQFLQNLYRQYEIFIQDISRVIPVISVDYDRFATAEEMAQVIQSEYLAHSFIRKVSLY